jgi:7-keto-8-aminopelargonate synthetase-like enzyme/predicted N-acyltransferase
MKNYHSFVQSVYQIAQNASFNGIAHLSTQDEYFLDNSIKINNHVTANFGSCSYLGLEFDERIKRGSIDATERFGTQFSSSRAYVSLGLYDQLEQYFRQIFRGNYALVTPTTTLGHIAAIPVLVKDEDAVILDHQVHSSIQNAVSMLKARGIHVDMIRHNNLDMLEQKIIDLKSKYKNIWYMADGIYSMYGDGAPVKQIHALLDKYDQFNFYVDDAHGMSCYGKNGAGYVMQQAAMHNKQVVAVSLAKAFATGGAVLIFPSLAQYQLVRSCGGPMITSGPMQPGNLGAAIASAQIHLSNELSELQSDLYENIKFTNLMLRKYGLPVVNETDSPVFFVGVSLPKIANSIIRKMVHDGYYLNLGIYPAVPLKNTGIRFTITRLHTFEQIEHMIARLAYNFEKTLLEEEFEIKKIYRAFKMDNPHEKEVMQQVSSLLAKTEIKVNTYTSITEVDKDLWNRMFEGRGSFDWDGIKLLENSFSNNRDDHNNWKFNYLIVSNQHNKPILGTFFTTVKTKDDMLSPAEISATVEDMRRIEGEDFLTSKSVMMGSPLTEGEHLYINKENGQWQTAMEEMFSFAENLQELHDADAVMYRDFSHANEELDRFLIENGFIKTDLPTNYVARNFEWNTEDEWLQTLSAKSRRHVRKNILAKKDAYLVRVIRSANQHQVNVWYDLYLQVKNSSLALNTYTLPKKLFVNLAKEPNWEIIELRLKHDPENVAAVIFNYISGRSYSAMFIGVNYAVQSEHMPYRQALYQSLLRARKLGMNQLNFGFTADLEKRRLGAKPIKTHGYMQIKDHYNTSVIANLTKTSHHTAHKVMTTVQ